MSMQLNRRRVAAVLALGLVAACRDGAPADAITGATPRFAAAPKVYNQIDRLANPLVSEVTVVKARHDLYNVEQPRNDVANFTGDVAGFVTGVAGRDPAYAAAIAGALLPDVLVTYPKRDGTPVFWLSWVFGGYGGRALADDVVDTGLGAIFGSLLGNTNNVTPGLTTDNVSKNELPFRTSFPYFANNH